MYLYGNHTPLAVEWLMFRRRLELIVLPPAEAPHEVVVLVRAVGASDHQMVPPFQRVDLAGHGEHNVGVLQLDMHLAAVPIL